MRINEIIKEGMDYPFDYQAFWEDEEVDPEDYGGEDEIPPGARMASLQKAHFTTNKGVKYGWYAKQSRYEMSRWEIVFGIIKKESDNKTSLDIHKTGTGEQQRVFATVLEILNDFVEYFEYDVNYIYFTADTEEGRNRANLYKRLIDRYGPDEFDLENVEDAGDEVRFTLRRNR